MIELIIVLFAGAFINACFSYFLDFCFGEDMIFKRWLPFLERTITDRSFWFKPLGGCVICANVWHGLITFPFIALFTGMTGAGAWIVPLMVAYLVVSSFFLRKMISE